MEYKKLPSNLELAKLPTHPSIYKRPPSYSDSFYIVKQPTHGSGTFEFLDLAQSAPVQPTLPTPPSIPPTPPTSPKPPTHPALEIALGFLFHITLISVFESAFFYLFISRSEDKGILTTVNNILHEVTATCPWPANQTALLRDLFTLLVNQTALEGAAASAAQARTAYNNRIFLQSWMYVAGLAGATGVAFAIAAWRGHLGYKAVGRIVLENLGLVMLLGVYEFAFFKTIIYNYDSISVLEIEGYAANQLQSQCGL